MKAIKIIATPDGGQEGALQDAPIPTVREGYVLCKVLCVGLNPTDWKHIDGDGGVPGCTVGSDMCGIVEDVGPNVTVDWKRGDRICAFVHGGNNSQFEDGTFAEYCLVKAGVGMKVPENISNEAAAALGVAVITCGQALYQSLGLPLPGTVEKSDEYLLVYGGSTGVGILAVQYAILSGYKVVATASEHNWPLLISLGVEAVFDYKDPNCSTLIREYTGNKLKLAFDCISEGSSPKICEQAISSTSGGTITYLLKSAHELQTRTDVVKKHTSGYTVLGESFDKLGAHVPAKPEDYEFTKKFWGTTEGLFASGKVKPHPITLGEGGLVGVFEGMQRAREGKVSGEKLVYRVEETPGLDGSGG